MSQPKYRLSRKDQIRWRELLVRYCLNAEGVPPEAKYPPLTPQENAEFESLDRERSRRICSHPLVQESLRCQRRADRRVYRLLKKLAVEVKAARRQEISKVKIKRQKLSFSC
jgi:predicted GNAT family acetyltransferase